MGSEDDDVMIGGEETRDNMGVEEKRFGGGGVDERLRWRNKSNEDKKGYGMPGTMPGMMSVS
jgi:hypothetical protein